MDPRAVKIRKMFVPSNMSAKTMQRQYWVGAMPARGMTVVIKKRKLMPVEEKGLKITFMQYKSLDNDMAGQLTRPVT